MSWFDKESKLWDKLPSFMLGHMTVRTTLRGESDDMEAEPWHHQPIERANLITSKTERYPYGVEYHRPVLDIDFPAELIPSSTPGHYHLYLDKEIPKASYMQLLRDLARAGIIQSGFADSAIERGASSARLPWIKKDDWVANQGEPEASVEKLRAEVKKAEQALAEAKTKLLRAEVDNDLVF